MSFWDSCRDGRRYVLARAFLIMLIMAGCGSGGSERAPGTLSTPEPVIPDSMTIDRMLETDDRFSTLRASLDSTGLDSLLAAGGPVTLFAPPNEAFDQLPPGTIDVLLVERRPRLESILAKHIIQQRISLEGLAGPQTITTMGGDTLTARPSGDRVTVEGIPILDDDIEAANGLIHVVERVLPPPASESQTE